MPVPIGPRQMRTSTSPGLSASGPWLLMARIAARSLVKTRAGPTLRYTPSASTTLGSMAVLLMTAPSGARLPRGNVTVDAVVLAQHLAQPGAALGALPPVEVAVERLAADREAAAVEQAEAAQVQHD